MTTSGLAVPAFTLVDNPPNARRTMEALRDLGYDSYTAVMDLIDNCLDAHAKNVHIRVVKEGEDIVIEVEDDGDGMDEETLNESLKLGSESGRESGDLGKFGMGLVTAAISLSQRVDVFTREAGARLLWGGFDLEMISIEDRFVKWVGEAPEAEQGHVVREQGTLVRLSNTDKISNRDPRTFGATLRKRIGQTFRKHLTAGLVITVNGQAAEPFDPLMLAHSETRLLLETDIAVDEQSTFSLRVVELPDFGTGAANKAQGIVPAESGFFIIRNNREILESHAFEFYKKHPDYSHFRAELCFDGTLDDVFHVDVKKMSINPGQTIIDKLRQATQGLITECGRKGRARANATKGQIDHTAAETNIAKRASLIPKPPSMVEVRKRKTKKGVHTKGNGERKRTPHLTELKTISGMKVTFEEGNYGRENPFYLVRAPVGRTIVIQYNRDHPFWRELVELATSPNTDSTKVVAVLDYLVFAMANTELLVPDQAEIVKANINTTLVGLLI